METLIVFIIALVITSIGALPFGLVNLSVLDTAYRSGTARAMHLSYGAAVIEVVYGITALTAGGLFAHFLGNYPVFNLVILAIPALVGLAFLLKNRYQERNIRLINNGFIRGIFLNLLSIQVLIYWLFAMTYLHALSDIKYNGFSIVTYILGILTGKLGILWLYALLSKKIYKRTGFLARNINLIIGVVLLFTSFFQIVR